MANFKEKTIEKQNMWAGLVKGKPNLPDPIQRKRKSKPHCRQKKTAEIEVSRVSLSPCVSVTLLTSEERQRHKHTTASTQATTSKPTRYQAPQSFHIYFNIVFSLFTLGFLLGFPLCSCLVAEKH